MEIQTEGGVTLFWVRPFQTAQYDTVWISIDSKWRKTKVAKMQNWKLEKLIPMPSFEQTLLMTFEETIILFHNSLSLSMKM